MTRAAAFLQAILADPDDDAPRLVDADWLDERGDPARGEFIRVQCQLGDCARALSPAWNRLRDRGTIRWRELTHRHPGSVMGAIAIIDRGRGPELAGTRITVFDVLHYREAGWHPSSIALWLGLSTAEVEALLRYAEEHRDEVMAAHRKIEERISRGNPPEVEAKRRESHAKLLARKAELERQRAGTEANGEGHPR
jgi:uncharacterized protein (TIGR02996 family)